MKLILNAMQFLFTFCPGKPRSPGTPVTPSLPGIPSVPCENDLQIIHNHDQLTLIPGEPFIPLSPFIPLLPFEP